MANCELLAGCIFFNDKMLDYLPATMAYLKGKYCVGDNHECARYTVFKNFGRERVPQDLFPNDVDRAKKIVSTS